MYVPILKSGEDNVGAWDPTTATLDWCEANYLWSYYIAEWWNTWSNLFMILPGLYGAWSVYRSGGEQRFIFSFLALSFVGSGSWLFHMTLAYPMQLVDELSMLYATCALFYCSFEMKSKRDVANYPLAACLVILASVISATYVAIGHPVFHQLCYSGMVVVLTAKIFYISRAYPRSVGWFILGITTYLAGFAVWEIDVHYCGALREARTGPASYVPALLEFHAWWHILAGVGTYLNIIFMTVTRSEVIKHPLDAKLWLGFIPVLVENRDLSA